jgi:hypothetical protein
MKIDMDAIEKEMTSKYSNTINNNNQLSSNHSSTGEY